MFKRHSDLPIHGDPSARFLPWLVSLMTFLTAIAVAVTFVLSGLVGRWDRDVSGTLTVQVSPVPGEVGDAGMNNRVIQAIALLKATPGVLEVKALDKAQTASLLEPWLGSLDVVRDLPLPRLIDVSIDMEKGVNISNLATRLKNDVAGASLDDHRAWLARLVQLSVSTQYLALGIVLLIGGVTTLTVIYATRTSMTVHKSVIEVLHQIGAHDDYIARQFAQRAFNQAFAGGLLGVGLAVPCLLGLGHVTDQMEGGFLPDLSLPVPGLVVIGLLPFASALLAMYTARIAVHGTLSRMP